ncbi:MAG: calcium-binding protein [Candidatus Dormiibacterota bacterium]
MTSRERDAGIKISKGRLPEMIEEATVDCHNDSELTTGWFTMIEDNLVVPFETRVLGVQVRVPRISLRCTDTAHL